MRNIKFWLELTLASHRIDGRSGAYGRWAGDHQRKRIIAKRIIVKLINVNRKRPLYGGRFFSKRIVFEEKFAAMASGREEES